MRKVVFLAIPLLTGCSLLDISELSETAPESSDQENFEVFSRYYCDRHGWPTEISEVKAFAEENEIPHQLDRYKNAIGSSSRKILYTVEYTTEQGSGDRRTVTFIAPPNCNQEGEKSDPSYVSMAGGGVTFNLAPQFIPLNAEQMKERWGDGPYPDVAWESSEEKLLVSARFGEVDASTDQIQSLQGPLEAAYEQSARGFTWKVRKFGTIRGTPWIRLGYESDSMKGRLYNSSLTTTFQGKLFTLSFTSPVEKETELSRLSRDVLQSITIATP